ncbi:MAG TPA: DUF4105 domain-containing protein [Steroidobacteraceae bacterium]
MTRPPRRWLSTLGVVLLAILLAGMTAWGVLALIYFDPLPHALRPILAAVFALAGSATLVALCRPRRRTPALTWFSILFAVLLLCWFQIAPTNEGQWRPEVAVLPYATLEGDLVTVHNIRNFDYRTETDFTPAYYNATFDAGKLSSVDLFAVYWMGPSISHGIISFGFADGQHLAVSIEARSPHGAGYSTIAGFFRQYEVHYVVADERDVIRLRTNYRLHPVENAYLFHLVGTPEDARHTFMNYIAKINSLKKQPEFYNSLTDNCITGIWQNARGNPGRPSFSWKLLLSGYAPEYLYEQGKLDRSVPFEVLRERGHINEKAHAADQDADFSSKIRASALEVPATHERPHE